MSLIEADSAFSMANDAWPAKLGREVCDLFAHVYVWSRNIHGRTRYISNTMRPSEQAYYSTVRLNDAICSKMKG
eukprot:scaffold149746_cov44-Prasinocladus_malaysianus.AAC.1